MSSSLPPDDHYAADVKTKIVLAAGLLFGLACLYGAVGSWVGVAQAEDATRTPGVVRELQCGYRGSCTGLFTSDDGSLRAHRVRVSGSREAGEHRAVFVPRIGNGLDGAIQSVDTAYVGSVTLNIAPDVLIAVVLSVLGALFTLPYVLIGVLVLGGRRRRGLRR
jgi:hypothetical protein